MTDFLNAQLQRYLHDERPATAFFDGPQIGVVVSVSGRDVHFVIPDFDPDVSFGPAPCDIGTPAVGDEITVVFVGTGVDQPRVVLLPHLAAADVEVTPVGDITATDVQAALAQLAADIGSAYGPSNPITKALIDALGVNADTLDGHDSTYFYSPANPPAVTVINQTIRGTISIGGTSIQTATIPTVNTAKTQLRHLGTNAREFTNGPLDATLQLTDSTTVTATQNSTTSGLTVAYELTEWT